MAEICAHFWGDEAVLATRAPHYDEPCGDARHRIHLSVAVKTFPEKSQVVVFELLAD
jgi:hypothetical protein